MEKHITYPEIFRFFLPLVLNAQMMFLSIPIINLGLSRTAGPEIAIAAYSVGWYFGGVLSSPSIVARNVATAFITDRESFVLLRKIFFLLGVAIMGMTISIAVTPLHDVIFLKIFGIPRAVAHQVRWVLLITAPLGVTVALRNVYQGVALVHKKPGVLAYATVVRLTTVTLVVFVSVLYVKLPGASSGALAMLCGMSMEAIFMYLLTRRLFKLDSMREEPSSKPSGTPLTLSAIFQFSYPLFIGVSMLILLPAIVNGLLSRTGEPEMALAGFGVMYPLVRFATSPLLGFQSTTMVLYRSLPDLKKLTWAALWLSLVFSLILFGVGYSPVGMYLLTDLFALDADLVEYTYPGMFVMFIFAIATGIRNHAQGILMNLKATRIISISAISKIPLALGTGLLLLWLFSGINGVILGIILVTLGEFCDNLFMGGAAVYKIQNQGC